MTKKLLITIGVIAVFAIGAVVWLKKGSGKQWFIDKLKKSIAIVQESEARVVEKEAADKGLCVAIIK
jgi:hypothetical protein